MGFDTVFPSDVDGTCFEFRFHQTEVFFDFPSLFVDFYDFVDIPFQVGYDSVKTIIYFFFFNLFCVQAVCLAFCDFAIWSEKSF